MTTNLSSIFESAMSEALIRHADIPDFPRIRTWRSIDAEGRWNPEYDRVLPVITVMASTPEPDPQGQRMVTVTVGAMTNAEDDQSHARIAEIEAALQEVLDRLETYYDGDEVRSTFVGRVADETASAGFEVHVGGVELGSSSVPLIDEGALVIGMQVEVHYSRSDRR